MGCKLGVEDCRSLLIPQVRYFVVVALHLLFAVRNSVSLQVYDATQLDALQSILKAWNYTPDIENNLAGWNTTQPYPCTQTLDNPTPRYRGVQCLTNIGCQYNATDDQTTCSAFIISLTLNNASIVGELPAVIGNITTLSTLELTGNPQLAGQLPSQIRNTNLFIFDVHDNDFSGSLPNLDNLLWLFKL